LADQADTDAALPPPKRPARLVATPPAEPHRGLWKKLLESISARAEDLAQSDEHRNGVRDGSGPHRRRSACRRHTISGFNLSKPRKEVQISNNRWAITRPKRTGSSAEAVGVAGLIHAMELGR